RALEGFLLRGEVAELRLDVGQLAFALLDEGGRLDELDVEVFALGGERVDVALQRLGALLHVLELLTPVLELLLGLFRRRRRLWSRLLCGIALRRLGLRQDAASSSRSGGQNQSRERGVDECRSLGFRAFQCQSVPRTVCAASRATEATIAAI